MSKRNSIIALFIISTIVLTGSSFGQEKSRKRKVSPPVNPVKSPRDSASGLLTGKRTVGWSMGASNPTVVGAPDAVRANQTNTKGKRRNPNFRPNPTGDGTTQQVGGDVHPGQDGMGGTGMVKGQSPTKNSQRTGRRKPFFRPNPTGDGTTEQVYGDVHPGEGDMGTGMVKNQSPNSANRRARRQAPIRKGNGPRQKPNAGFMDYTDDAAMTQVQAGQNSQSNQPQANSEDKLGNFEIQRVKAINGQCPAGYISANGRENPIECVRQNSSTQNNVNTAREAGSGMATGRRQYEPLRATPTNKVGNTKIDGGNTEQQRPRRGKRQRKP